jgi:hypothetical protein
MFPAFTTSHAGKPKGAKEGGTALYGALSFQHLHNHAKLTGIHLMFSHLQTIL